MIDNSYHKKIAYHVHETEKNQKRHDPDELVHDEPKSANMYANALKNMTLKKMGGGYSDKVNDTHRVELENAMGAGSATTVYKKQLPKYGNGKPNMEMEDERESIIKRGGAKIPPNTFGRIQQAVLTGGSEKEKTDLVDVIINKLMSGKKANAKELEVDEKLGAGWTDAVKGISAGAKPTAKKPPMKKDIRLGRGMDADAEVHGNGTSVDKRKLRAECIKRIMREQGMKMIEASKYIKSNNIKY